MTFQANSLECLADPEDPTFDIVAVHGLNPLGVANHALHTWTAPNGKVWLRDFLPATLQKEKLGSPNTSARIFYYEYNANVAFHSSTAGVDGAAQSLLNHLYLKRQEFPKRPIVFICHSLGGLVVKQALCSAKLNNKYNDIKNCTRGLVFMSTPHQGGNYVALGTIAARIASVLVSRSKNDLMKSLTKNDLLTEKRSDDFRHQLEDYYIISFYETLGFQLKRKRIGLIVDKQSAVLGLPGSREEAISLEADHASICKYDSEKNDIYVQVSGNIKDMMEKIVREERAQSERFGMAQRKADGTRVTVDNIYSVNEHWLVRRRGNPMFTGRDDLIDRLEKALVPSREGEEPSQRPIFVLSGLGGIGKSETALQFVQKFRSRFWGIFWIDCSTANSIHFSFQEVAKACNVQLTQSGPVTELTKHILANSSYNWLLVLDNCDDPEMDYGQLFPSGLRGAILMTTRLLDCERHATGDNKQNLINLPMHSASDLVLKAAKIETSKWGAKRSAANQMATILGQHPLAIILGGAYVSDRLCSLEEYPNVFRTHSAMLLNHAEEQVYADYGTVYATFEVSMRHLEQSSKTSNDHALQLLRVIAHMHAQGITENIFVKLWGHMDKVLPEDESSSIYRLTKWHVARSDEFLEQVTPQNRLHTFKVARSILCKLSLASFDEDHQSFSLHPLIHAWAKARLATKAQLAAWLTTASMLALSTEEVRFFDRFPFETQRHLEACLDAYHIQAQRLRELDEGVRFQVLRILFCFVSELRVVQSRSVLYWARTLAEDAKSISMLPSSARSDIKYLYGRCLLQKHNNKEAIEVFEDLAKDQATLSPDDPDRLSTQDMLACAYLADGQVERGVEVIEKVVELEAPLPPENLSKLSSLGQLGLACIANGQDERGIKLLQEVVARHSYVLPANHPDRLRYEVRLARAYSGDEPTGNPQNKKGLEMLEGLVRIMDETMPSDYPDLLKSKSSLARAYLVDGQILKATEMAEEMVRIRVAMHPEGDTELFDAQLELGMAYLRAKENRRAAQTLLEGLVAAEEKVFRPEHPRLLDARYQLGTAYFMNQEYHKAITMFEQAWNGYRNTLRADHPDCISARKALAISYAILDQCSTDLELQLDINSYWATWNSRSPEKSGPSSTVKKVLGLNWTGANRNWWQNQTFSLKKSG